MKRFVLCVVGVVLLSLVSLYFGMRKYGSWALDEFSGVSKQEALHLVCGADRYWRVDPSRLPTDLKNVLPLVQKWSVSDPIILLDCFNKTGDAELRQIVVTAEQIAPATRSFLASGVPANAEEAMAFRNFQDVAILAREVIANRERQKV